MDALTVAAASGMRARLEALDLLANNIANAATTGFKADREFYGLYASAQAMDAEFPASTVPVVERNWIDFAQGPLEETGGELHLALQGSGFFVVQGKDGPLLTRNGKFAVGREGLLQNLDGYPLNKVGGGILQIDPKGTVEVRKDGTVLQAGLEVGRIQVGEVEKPQSLEKLGNTYFRMSSMSGAVKPATATVWQGRLEAANFGAAENAVRLVQVMRQFEMLQRAVALGAEMGRRSVEEVARVNG